MQERRSSVEDPKERTAYEEYKKLLHGEQKV